MPKGDHVYEENIKIDSLSPSKTNEPVHLRNQAIMVLAHFLVGDKTRRIIPFFTRATPTNLPNPSFDGRTSSQPR
jgi:hypothetical protein